MSTANENQETEKSGDTPHPAQTPALTLNLSDAHAGHPDVIGAETASTDATEPRQPGDATETPQAMTTIVLVRHGHTPTTGRVLPGRAPGLDLSESGAEQARSAAERLSQLGTISAVYASPMERAQQTAGPIAEGIGLPVQTHTGLNECDFGDWTGAELAKLRELEQWRTVQRYPSGFRFPGGESFTEMQTRMTTALAHLVAAHSGETIVAVSHADTIKAAVADALGAHLDQFQRIIISPCSITTIGYTSSGPLVLAVNSTVDGPAGVVR